MKKMENNYIRSEALSHYDSAILINQGGNPTVRIVTAAMEGDSVFSPARSIELFGQKAIEKLAGFLSNNGFCPISANITDQKVKSVQDAFENLLSIMPTRPDTNGILTLNYYEGDDTNIFDATKSLKEAMVDMGFMIGGHQP